MDVQQATDSAGSSSHISALLPTHAPVPSIDLSIFTHCIQKLEARIVQLETTTAALQSENRMLSEKTLDLSQQTLVSQDQYGSLYDTVHEGLKKITILQSSAYEKAQAVMDFSTVQHQVDVLKEETARLERAKIDVGSSELEARVEHTAADCATRLLVKFEKENREWTANQLGIAEERIGKITAAKLGESDAKIDVKLNSMQGNIDDVVYKEAMMRKEVDAQAAAVTNVMRNIAGKLETHEKHLDSAEESLFGQIDVIRRKFEVFLEHCVGVSWPSLLSGIAITSTLLRLDARKALSEPPSELNFRRGTTRTKRGMDNLRDWRRLQTVNPRIVLGMGDITKKLENGDEQIESTAQSRLQQRRTDDAALEQQHNNELESQFQLLGEYMALMTDTGGEKEKEVDAGILAHPAVQALRHMLEAPLFSHIRASLSSEVRQSMSLSKEEFGQEYSNQLALVNKELRGKATLAGLEDTIKDFASRTLKVQLEVIEKQLADVSSAYVSKSTLMELLSSKADALLLERKANEVDVQTSLGHLRSEMEALHQRAASDIQTQMMSRFTDLTRDMGGRRDVKPLGVVPKGSDDGVVAARVQSVGGGHRCLSCNQESQGMTAAGASVDHGIIARGPTPRSATRQRADGYVSPEEPDYIQLVAGLQSSSVEDAEHPVTGATAEVICVSTGAVAQPNQAQGGVDPRPSAAASRDPSFRMKDWVENVEKKFGLKERKTPRPPSASSSTTSLKRAQ